MKKETFLKGLLAAAAVVAVPHLAFAGDLNASVTQLTGTELVDVPDVIGAVFFIGGCGFVGSGLISLKKYSENPQGEPLGKGIGRLGVGAALLALPFIANSVIKTFAFNGAAAQYQKFTPVM